MSKSVYEMVTERIIEELEKEVPRGNARGVEPEAARTTSLLKEATH